MSWHLTIIHIAIEVWHVDCQFGAPFIQVYDIFWHICIIIMLFNFLHHLLTTFFSTNRALMIYIYTSTKSSLFEANSWFCAFNQLIDSSCTRLTYIPSEFRSTELVTWHQQLSSLIHTLWDEIVHSRVTEETQLRTIQLHNTLQHIIIVI